MHPFINIWGKQISSYGLCMAAAFLLAVLLSARRAKKKGIAVEDVIIIAAAAVGIGLLCGKLLYILVSYSASDIAAFVKARDFSFIGSGGIVFYGGLLGGIGGAFLGARIAKTRLCDIESCVVPFIPLGHAIGRVGCFLAGCCYGMEYDGLFCVFYKNSIFGLPPDSPRFPVQLLEAFLDILIMLYLLHYEKKSRRRYDLLFTYLLLYAVMRFFTEFLRGDAVRGIYFALSTSQWISIGLLLAYVVYKLAGLKGCGKEGQG